MGNIKKKWDFFCHFEKIVYLCIVLNIILFTFKKFSYESNLC